jgi:hypothetical protein
MPADPELTGQLLALITNLVAYLIGRAAQHSLLSGRWLASDPESSLQV